MMAARRMPLGTPQTAIKADPISAAWNTVASCPTYAEAQTVVDRLSDDGFPVEHLDIVGSDLRLIERVTGRLTNGSAAMAGAASGAWFGLFIGLFLGIFSSGNWFGLIVYGLVVGAIWGAALGYLGHSAWRGTRDFASTQALVATRYDVVARDGQADAARTAIRAAGLIPVEHAVTLPPK
ncbi:MAG: hypothetical protein QOF39_477 [Frankiales bacterium]|jgi:hypothetical protein|nr:hypothetical protein [Frankiales bacterium]